MSTSIYQYRKASNPWTEITMSLPEGQGADSDVRCTELCTLDGITYVAVPDCLTLPPQPPEIQPERATITPELRERIKAESTHCQLIAQRLIDRIRARFSVDDEAFLMRITIGQLSGAYKMSAGEAATVAEYQRVAEEARAWAKAERAKLGL